MLSLSRLMLAKLRELPLLVGVVIGCIGMWWRGRAFVPMDWPAGFDWERYLRETWAYFNPGTMNSTWLEPLYSYMLGNLGNAVGWAWAGMLISSIGVLLIVLGSGILGRAMAGPWVGAVAAMSIPLTPNLAAAARWVNVYPALSGATAMGLACMVAMTRWPRLGWALSGGVFVGLAWALDGRTVPLLPGFILLRLVGKWRDGLRAPNAPLCSSPPRHVGRALEPGHASSGSQGVDGASGRDPAGYRALQAPREPQSGPSTSVHRRAVGGHQPLGIAAALRTRPLAR